MKKTWTISFIVAVTAIVALFVASFFDVIPLGAPSLKLEFEPTPPWHVRPGNSFRIEIAIANNAWLLAFAKSVRAEVTTLEGFTIVGTNANLWTRNLGTLRGGDRRNDTITVMVSNNVLPRNYTLAVKVLGENAPEQILTPQVVVELPYIP